MKLIKKLSLIFCISLPVMAFTFKFSILDRQRTFGGDWGYFSQLYEAARLSIVKYHEFPWWNSWSIGGVPLYANPQFGLFSIPMLLVLIFGTITGLHISVMVYFLLGFWGMYLLLNRLHASSKYISILLSYIWIFSGFPVSHMAVGHLTFSAYLLCPWFFLTLINIHKKKGWIWFSLVASYLIVQSPHYIAIEVLAIGAMVVLVQLVHLYYSKKYSMINLLRPYLKCLLIILPLVFIKLFFVFQYLHEYPRLTSLDAVVSSNLLVSSLTLRNFQSLQMTLKAQYHWWEYADYIGIISFALFCYLFISNLVKNFRLDVIRWAIIISIGVAFLLSMGPFSEISPYTLIHHLPIFNEMRIPSRWIGWVSFGIILYLARLPKKPIIYILLVLSLVDVCIANYGILNSYQAPYTSPNSYSQTVIPYEYYNYNQTSLSAVYATQSNVDQVDGYEPILGFGGDYNPDYYSTVSNRCGIKQGCNFIESKNAVVKYWSPLKIILKRTSSGPIILDMNPGKNWVVNGSYIFKNYRVIELKKNFVITNPAQNIVITFSPTF